jgi:hypothetical protein
MCRTSEEASHGAAQRVQCGQLHEARDGHDADRVVHRDVQRHESLAKCAPISVHALLDR